MKQRLYNVAFTVALCAVCAAALTWTRRPCRGLTSLVPPRTRRAGQGRDLLTEQADTRRRWCRLTPGTTGTLAWWLACPICLIGWLPGPALSAEVEVRLRMVGQGTFRTVE